MDQLLTRVEVPRRHGREAFAQRVDWYSWSAETLHLIKTNLKYLVKLPAPPCIWVRGCDPYPSTYSYRLSALSEPLAFFATETAEALLRVRVGARLRFTCGMLEPPLTSPLLHRIFALIRAGIARVNGDPRTALHAPVKTKRHDEGFALHSDLFLTERLFLIFDNVPSGESGKSLFLSREEFEAAVAGATLMPRQQQTRLRTLMRVPVNADSFDNWFDLVYSSDNPWNRQLVRSIKQASSAIKFHRGEGYLLHDRRWLHGRTAAKGGVTETRFRRLVYGRTVVNL